MPWRPSCMGVLVNADGTGNGISVGTSTNVKAWFEGEHINSIIALLCSFVNRRFRCRVARNIFQKDEQRKGWRTLDKRFYGVAVRKSRLDLTNWSLWRQLQPEHRFWRTQSSYVSLVSIAHHYRIDTNTTTTIYPSTNANIYSVTSPGPRLHKSNISKWCPGCDFVPLTW